MRLLPLLLIPFIIGCNEASTPQSAIQHFFHAIQTNSVSELEDYLAWHAYEEFANAKGLSRLRKVGLRGTYNIIGQTGQKIVNDHRRVDYYTAEVAPLWVRVACISELADDNTVRFCFLDVIE